MIARFKVTKSNTVGAEELTEKGKVAKKDSRALVLTAVASPEGQSNPWVGQPNGAFHIGGVKVAELADVKIGDEVIVEIRKA